MAAPTTRAQLAQSAAPTPLDTINTPADFARAVLNALGAPDTPQNEQALIAWAAAEGGNWNNTALYNPFNTTLPMPGSQVMAGGNTAGVQAYTSWRQGVDATVKTLQGSGYYSRILSALQQGNDAAAVVQAVVNSPWGTKSIDLGSAGSYASQSGGFAGSSVYSAAAGSGQTSGSAQDSPYNAQFPYGLNVSPQVMTWIQQNAGQDSWMLAKDTSGKYVNPELANILAWAGQYQITDPNEIQSLIAQTNWYKTHSEAQRQWITTYGADPSAAQKAIQDSSANIQTIAGGLGIQMSQDQLNQLAINSNYYGWTPDELKAHIGALSTVTAPSANLDQLKQGAMDFMVPLSDQTAQQWLTNINSGLSTPDQYTAYLKNQAKTLYNRYPDMVTAINQGISPSAYLDPYKQAAAQLLGVAPDSINFNNPKWGQSLFGPQTASQGTPQGQGNQNPQGLPDIYTFQTTLRSNPVYGWQNTQDARAQGAALEQQLLQEFGKM